MTGVLAPAAVGDVAPAFGANQVPTQTSRELEAVASMLRSRFPDRIAEDIDQLVADVHAQLPQHARVRTHLIPLTLNHCRNALLQT